MQQGCGPAIHMDFRIVIITHGQTSCDSYSQAHTVVLRVSCCLRRMLVSISRVDS